MVQLQCTPAALFRLLHMRNGCKINLNEIYRYLICYFLINFFFLQARSLGREPSPMELFVKTHVQSEDDQKGVQQFIVNRAQHFMVCSFNHFFRKLLFFLN